MSTNFKSIKADKTTETRDNHSLEQQELAICSRP